MCPGGPQNAFLITNQARKTMNPDLKWIITRVDGKVSSVSLNYSGLAKVVANVMKMSPDKVDTITTEKVTMDRLIEISKSLTWEDMNIFGTDFQKHVWAELFKLNHTPGLEPRLMSYSEFATICGNRPGIRAVAHALGLNPCAYIIPCHRIVPKETIDRIAEVEAAAQKTLFKGADIWLFDAVDFGEYALGKNMKRDIIAAELDKN